MLIVLLAVLAPLVSHADPLAIDLVNQLQGPSRAALARHRHPGARRLGAARLRRAHLALGGIVSQAIALTLGLTLGLIAGY